MSSGTTPPSPNGPSRLVDSGVRAIEFVEDCVHLVVALLLAALAVTLVVDTVRHIVVLLGGPYNLPLVVLGILDETLLLIVAELMHTTAIALRHHGALDPEPFVVMRLVAGIRRVLIVTAEAEQSFHWNPQGIELLVLIGLILAMAFTTFLWRRSARRRDPT